MGSTAVHSDSPVNKKQPQKVAWAPCVVSCSGQALPRGISSHHLHTQLFPPKLTQVGQIALWTRLFIPTDYKQGVGD